MKFAIIEKPSTIRSVYSNFYIVPQINKHRSTLFTDLLFLKEMNSLAEASRIARKRNCHERVKFPFFFNYIIYQGVTSEVSHEHFDDLESLSPAFNYIRYRFAARANRFINAIRTYLKLLQSTTKSIGNFLGLLLTF